MNGKRYMDSAGNQYFVRHGGVWGWKAYIHTPDGHEHGCRHKGLGYRDAKDEAQTDLDRLAERKGWKIYHEGTGNREDQSRDGKQQDKWTHCCGW